MRRDLLYLGAVTVNAALMVEFGYALLLAAVIGGRDARPAPPVAGPALP